MNLEKGGVLAFYTSVFTMKRPLRSADDHFCGLSFIQTLKIKSRAMFRS